MIGSSSGAFFKDSFNRELGLNDNRDYMDINPDMFMSQKANPPRTIDDQGGVVPDTVIAPDSIEELAPETGILPLEERLVPDNISEP